MGEINLTLYDYSVKIESTSENIIERLNSILLTTESLAQDHDTLITVRSEQNGYRVVWENLKSPFLSNEIIATLYIQEWLYRILIYSLKNSFCLHAGFFSGNFSNTIFVGPKGSGKTTILCGMYLNGFKVFSDEFVVIQNKNILPVPRKFHVKEGTIDILSKMKTKCEELIPYPSYFGGSFYFFNPELSNTNHIHSKKTNIVFISKRSELSPELNTLKHSEMIKLILKEILYTDLNNSTLIKNICHFVSCSSCYILYPGEINKTINLLSTRF